MALTAGLNKPEEKMKLRIAAGLLLLSFYALGAPEGQGATNDTPEFQEVYELLRANLAGTDEGELNRAAVRGLLSQLQSRASLSGESKETSLTTPAESAI